MPNPRPPPPKKKERYVTDSTAVTSFLFRGGGGGEWHPITESRVGLVLEAGLFVSNPKFRDRVLEYSTLTQAAGAVSCRHECPVYRLLGPKVRGSDVRVLQTLVQ